MNEFRKLKRGISTKRGEHLVQNGQNPFDESEEQQRYWPSPRAPPVSPMGSPRTPGGSQKKPVLGKVKSKAKKWMHLLHHKKKPAQEEVMWTPRAGPSADGSNGREEERASEYHGTPSTARHPLSCMPVPSPTASKEQPYFMVSSRFESEMKEANEMLRESKQLRVNTGKQKTPVPLSTHPCAYEGKLHQACKDSPILQCLDAGGEDKRVCPQYTLFIELHYS